MKIIWQEEGISAPASAPMVQALAAEIEEKKPPVEEGEEGEGPAANYWD